MIKNEKLSSEGGKVVSSWGPESKLLLLPHAQTSGKRSWKRLRSQGNKFLFSASSGE